MNESDEPKYDLNQIMVRPLYFGLLVNVLAPMALLFVCYYFETRGGRSNLIGGAREPLLYIVTVIAVLQAGLAYRWKQKLLTQPMIHRKETFEDDLIHELKQRVKPIFYLLAAISLYGVIYYFLAGEFMPAVFIVLLSFIAFQLIRPRFGFLGKLIARQEEMVSEGKFAPPSVS